MGSEREKMISHITNKFNSLKTTQKFFVCIFIVVLLIFGSNILSKIKLRYDIINYNNYSIEELISSSELCNNRLIFLQIEEIVSDLISSSKGEKYINKDKVTLDDYYEYAVFSDYKYKLGKGKFKKEVKEIAKTFKNSYGVEDPLQLEDASIIGNVYTYSPSYKMYIAEINLENELHYIGVKFSMDNMYTIFYID